MITYFIQIWKTLVVLTRTLSWKVNDIFYLFFWRDFFLVSKYNYFHFNLYTNFISFATTRKNEMYRGPCNCIHTTLLQRSGWWILSCLTTVNTSTYPSMFNCWMTLWTAINTPHNEVPSLKKVKLSMRKNARKNNTYELPNK